MPPPWTTYAGLIPPDCVVCCTSASGSVCFYDIASVATSGNPPIADYATAVKYLDGTLAQADCFGWAGTSDWPGPITFTADVSTPNELALSASFTNTPPAGQSNAMSQFASMAVAEGDVLTFNWVIGSFIGFGEIVIINMATEAVIEDFFFFSSTGSHSSPTLPVGQYTIKFQTFGAVDDTNFDAACTIVSSLDMVPLPIVASWDDSGTTRYLDACPRLLLPPLTESTDDWYSDLTSAENAIDDQVLDCIAYIIPSLVDSRFSSITVSGFTLNGTRSAVALGDVGLSAYYSINGVAGDVLTWTWDNAPKFGSLVLFDYNGAQIDIQVSATSPINSIALPYTGRFTVQVGLTIPQSASASGTLTSSGTIGTPNPVQALYDKGLDCPARLECT